MVMQDRALAKRFFILLLMVTLFASILMISTNQYFPISNTQALSPSFVRQEIVAAPNDWKLWKGLSHISTITTHDGHSVQIENAKNISECKIGDRFVSPSIESVSYTSNGTMLNGTVWLNSNFQEPPLKDTLDIYPKQLEIKVSDLTKTSPPISPEKYAALKFDELQAKVYNPLNNLINVTFDQQKSNFTTISGHHAYRVIYSARNGQGVDFKNMTLWTTNGNKAYDITYSALRSNYSTYLPIIQNMIRSIEFEGASNASGQVNIHNNNIPEFNGLGIKMNYPIEWEKGKEATKSQSGSVIFRAPFEDEGLDTPSWHETAYTMAIAIDSVQHAAVTDYRVILNRTQASNTNNSAPASTWTRQVFEVSAYGKPRLLEQEKNYTTFHDKDSPYVLFYFNLNKVNFPQQYKAVFYITDYFVNRHIFCRLVDITNWIIIPPPEFSMSITPNSAVVLRPGEEKDLELMLKGNTHLPSEASLIEYINKTNNKDLNLSFIPNKVSISPFSAGISNLHVRALDNAKPESYLLPIVANISFPNTITNRGGETFSNSKRESLSQTSNLTLTVIPPYTINELFSNFISSWITPITGLWTFLAGVGAVVAPWAIAVYRKNQKHQQYKRNEKEKDDTE